ncbi:hypothetical protein IHE49_00570 [Rhodanobacter sp. 7MK24]|uniref:hypothetical protein n=1 Tax=Rhodanobacter sp. 7MK24 TaxID=2775922 RepID=UPI00177BCD96|nr:hypothetical protein [Rhodanobacter sp. 7MK24]MBD8878966.1 hypothetical protein [Rhodanobacter sp. 7MK24]
MATPLHIWKLQDFHIRHSGIGRASAQNAERPQGGLAEVSAVNHPVTVRLEQA